MSITSNYHWRDFKNRDQVPQDILNTQFDYQDSETYYGYIHYKGFWYHCDQFMRFNYPGPCRELGWQASYYNILIKLNDEGQYQIAFIG